MITKIIFKRLSCTTCGCSEDILVEPLKECPEEDCKTCSLPQAGQGVKIYLTHLDPKAFMRKEATEQELLKEMFGKETRDV